MAPDSYRLRRLSGGDSSDLFRQIAVLHAELIHGGVLPLLGVEFLATLYREIAGSAAGSVHAAVQGDRVVGFACGASDAWRCALGLSPTGYLRLLSTLALRVWRPKILWKVCDSLAYPFREPSALTPGMPRQSRHRAELLALAVTPTAQGTGLGLALVRAFEATLRGKADEYFVMTNAADAVINRYYSALGYLKVGQKRHHDLTIQVYTKRVGD